MSSLLISLKRFALKRKKEKLPRAQETCLVMMCTRCSGELLHLNKDARTTHRYGPLMQPLPAPSAPSRAELVTSSGAMEYPPP